MWDECDEESLDHWVSDWMVESAEVSLSAVGDLAEEHPDALPLPRSFFGAVLSSLARTRPRLRLKTAWRVYNVWGQRIPVRQAPAAPPEVLFGVAVLLACVGRPIYSAIMVACFTGLFASVKPCNPATGTWSSGRTASSSSWGRQSEAWSKR